MVVVGLGLLGYALWRLVEAVIDPYREGRGFKGIALRSGAVASGIVNAAVGIAALRLVIDGHHGGEKTKPLVASLLREPWGPAVLVALGIGVVGAGVYQIYSAYADKFADHLRVSQLSAARRAWTFWSGRIGHAARGVIFGIIGVAFVEAALHADPRHAKGFKEVMVELASQPFGRVLFGLVAAGFLAYGLHLVTTARCRKLV